MMFDVRIMFSFRIIYRQTLILILFIIACLTSQNMSVYYIMDLYRDFMKRASAHELLLGGLFVIYSGLDINAPMMLNEFAASTMGAVILVAVAISMFYYLSPVVAILGMIAVYELIRRARAEFTMNPSAMITHLPQTSPDCRDLNAYNQFSTTLEQDMVNKMAPLVGPSVGEVSFSPEVADDHHATQV